MLFKQRVFPCLTGVPVPSSPILALEEASVRDGERLEVLLHRLAPSLSRVAAAPSEQCARKTDPSFSSGKSQGQSRELLSVLWERVPLTQPFV
jgi:hypothetical protein